MSRLADYVVETASNPGTGTVSLAGAPTGRRSFMAALGAGAAYYYITDGVQAEWGSGTIAAGTPNTLSRDTVLGNTAGTTAKLNFTGTVTVYNALPATRALRLNGTGTQVTGLPSGTAAAPALAPDSDLGTGEFFPADNVIAWSAGGVERMRLTSTGLGLGGVTNPAVPLDVAAGAAQIGLRVRAHTDGVGAVQFTDAGGSTEHALLRVQSDGAASFRTGAAQTERWAVDSSGNMTVHKQLRVGGTNALGIITTTAATATASNAMAFFNSNGAVGSITTEAFTTTYYTTSDYRIKVNFRPMTGAVQRIKAIPVYRGEFVGRPGEVVDYFLAHEVQAGVPAAVTGRKDAVDEQGRPRLQMVDHSKLAPLHHGALLELIERDEAKDALIAALAARIDALEARLA